VQSHMKIRAWTQLREDNAAPIVRKNCKGEPGKVDTAEDRRTDHMSPIIVHHQDPPP
jgi:hypothetical protein